MFTIIAVVILLFSPAALLACTFMAQDILRSRKKKDAVHTFASQQEEDDAALLYRLRDDR